MAAPRIIETDVTQLWAEELRPAQEPASSLDPSSSDSDAMSSSQHACANTRYRAFVGMFVPHNRLSVVTRAEVVS